MQQMYQSLQKLTDLPDDTKIYCGHEYTLTNAKFLLSVDPENIELKQRAIELQEMRDLGQPTVPSIMDIEKETNLFLKAETLEEFTHLRSAKDSF